MYEGVSPAVSAYLTLVPNPDPNPTYGRRYSRYADAITYVTDVQVVP